MIVIKPVIVFMICFFIFCAWLAYEQRKRQRKVNKAREAFWSREEEANRTRRKDISHLPLIQVAEEEIPVVDTADEGIQYAIQQVRQNITEPMLDLSEYSNTDLKLAYGVGNFKTLSDYDENFNSFLINLTNLARIYTRNEYLTESCLTYELAFRYGSQKISDYTELAKNYLLMDKPEKIGTLISELQQSELPRKDSIIDSLKDVLATYQ